MKYVFGPVPSRRLGLSLGLDLIPAKTCTYDCLYCQVGKTTEKDIEPQAFAPVEEVRGELKEILERTNPDTITLAGSGEPTLHSGIDTIISSIKELTDTRIALLTNGALLWKEEVRTRVLGSDIILPTLSTVFEDTFHSIHRPHRALNLNKIIEGIKNLRREYRGLIYIEVVLLAGFNDTERELEGLKRVMEEISPDRIQLNTVVRPPSDARAQPVNSERLEHIKEFFGKKAEIIAHSLGKRSAGETESRNTAIIEMAKRRPVRSIDIVQSLNIPMEETERIVKGLVIKGGLKKQEHEGEIFFIAQEL